MPATLRRQCPKQMRLPDVDFIRGFQGKINWQFITRYDIIISTQNRKDRGPLKILVFSDSHDYMPYMERFLEALQPDAVIHLGDYFRDAMALRQKYEGIKLYQVAGNCDGSVCQPVIRTERLGGVSFYITHGHRHRVKIFLGALLEDARAAGADIVLYGHTHRPDCHREPDGLWVLNPGSSGLFGGTAAVIEISDGKIDSIRLISREEL